MRDVPLLSSCSRCVFSSFRRVEKLADRITGRAGPVFVTLALILISACIFTFFDVVYPRVFLHDDASWLYSLYGTCWSSYLVLMFSYHYYKCLVISPGTPTEPQRTASSTDTRSLIGQLIPSALCFGPLRGLTSSNKRKESDARRSKAIREIQAAQQRASAAAQASSRQVGSEKDVDGASRQARAARKARSCKKCPRDAQGERPPKPERTHHCKVCQTCILKFDHHCPWIKQCVGLHNERYFLLFMCYFSVACGFAAWWGWDSVWDAVVFGPWPHHAPRGAVLLYELLTAIMSVAVGIMAIFQIWLIALGETAVESHDNDWYRKMAASRGREFRNPYHLGWKENFRLFFNIGEGRYHWITIFLPIEVPPTSDGWTWQKIEGWDRYAMTLEDELTDEEQASEGEEFD